MGKKPLGQLKHKQPECSVCNIIYKNYKFIGGRMITGICKCNMNLLDEEAERILKKQKSKIENNPNYMRITIVESRL